VIGTESTEIGKTMNAAERRESNGECRMDDMDGWERL